MIQWNRSSFSKDIDARSPLAQEEPDILALPRAQKGNGKVSPQESKLLSGRGIEFFPFWSSTGSKPMPLRISGKQGSPNADSRQPTPLPSRHSNRHCEQGRKQLHVRYATRRRRTREY
mmetsp:Transcript_20062/g.46550  ORF Transcript_20062/g.46550 Transcript_20062/m.46550 type:complete len:118 (+) Transcript_20062:397-750(+)